MSVNYGYNSKTRVVLGFSVDVLMEPKLCWSIFILSLVLMSRDVKGQGYNIVQGWPVFIRLPIDASQDPGCVEGQGIYSLCLYVHFNEEVLWHSYSEEPKKLFDFNDLRMKITSKGRRYRGAFYIDDEGNKLITKFLDFGRSVEGTIKTANGDYKIRPCSYKQGVCLLLTFECNHSETTTPMSTTSSSWPTTDSTWSTTDSTWSTTDSTWSTTDSTWPTTTRPTTTTNGFTGTYFYPLKKGKSKDKLGFTVEPGIVTKKKTGEETTNKPPRFTTESSENSYEYSDEKAYAFNDD